MTNEMTVGPGRVVMNEGDTVFVPRGADHYISNRAEEPFELFYVFAPAAPPHPARQADRYPVVEFTPG